MTSALLIDQNKNIRATGCGDMLVSGNSCQDFQTADAISTVGTSAEQLHLQQILSIDIRYIHSSSFETPGAAETIIGWLRAEGSEANDGNPKRNVDTKLAVAPPGTPPYLASLYSTPLLTREGERFLFRKMNFLKYSAQRLQRRLDPKRPQVEKLDQITEHLSESLRIRNKIVSANLRLVVSIAKPLVDFANEFDEIISDGNVPLVRAVELFDFERGTRFGTYATWAVRNCLYRATMRNRRRRKRFLPAGDAIGDSLADHRLSVRGSETYHHEMRQAVRKMLEQLDTRDQMIISARFGLDGDRRPQKFREIAEKLNLSTERVRQLTARSLKCLSIIVADNEPVELA